MRNYFVITLAVFMGMALACTTAVQAETIVNVDIQRSSGVDYAAAGAAVDDPGNTFWNILEGASGVTNLSMDDLTASDGTTPTTVDVSLTNFTNTAAYTNGNALQYDRVYLNPGVVGTFSIAQLDAGTSYDIYLFTGTKPTGTYDLSTDFTISGTTKTASGLTKNTPNGGSWVAGDHYVVFEGLTGSTSISGTFTNTPSVGTWGCLAGMQIVAVPEPSALVALAGLLAMLFVRRLTR